MSKTFEEIFVEALLKNHDERVSSEEQIRLAEQERILSILRAEEKRLFEEERSLDASYTVTNLIALIKGE